MNHSYPEVIILSCAGAADGAINAIRSMGAMGIPVTLITEEEKPCFAYSRYVRRHVYLPRYIHTPSLLMQFLSDQAAKQKTPIVVMPSADPDMMLLSRLRAQMPPNCIALAPDRELGEALSDKARFAALADNLQLPVPRTFVPATATDIQNIANSLRFPAIIKPSNPTNWDPSKIEGLTNSTKAVRVDGPAELIRIAELIANKGFPFLIQEFIPGQDSMHYDLHALIGKNGKPIATFVGQKHRLFPPHAGAGCFTESLRVDELVALGLEILSRIGFAGLANLNFKRHEITGEFSLLEINPRLSHWHILTTRCGVNLPYLAYAEAAGLPIPEKPPSQREGQQYLNFRYDISTIATYVAAGEMTWCAYFRSLSKPWRITYQNLSLRDPMPLAVDTWLKFRNKFF